MRELLQNLPDQLDLTDPAHLTRVTGIADAILARSRNDERLADLEREWLEDRAVTPLMAHVAVKLARSRAKFEQLGQPLHLSVVVAVFREHTRILTREEHPQGEDFLREKIRQLRWLFADIPNASWSITVVDDGCPENSGEIARRILEESTDLRDIEAKVLFLRDALEAKLDVVRPLRSTDESRKGGSILLGMWDATLAPRPGHIVLYTDADLSTHLGQAGSLIDPLLRGEADAAVGSRREASSISTKDGTRDVRGKLFIYLSKRLFPPLRDIIDTQCGFKAFTAATVQEIVKPSLEKQFAFDIELLLKTELGQANRIRSLPVAWIDSDAASTTADLQPYLPMLRAMAGMVRHYLPGNRDADEFLALIDALDDDAWNRLVDSVPTALTERDPHSFGEWRGVTAAELRECAERS